jgi:hypothetical protein
MKEAKVRIGLKSHLRRRREKIYLPSLLLTRLLDISDLKLLHSNGRKFDFHVSNFRLMKEMQRVLQQEPVHCVMKLTGNTGCQTISLSMLLFSLQLDDQINE